MVKEIENDKSINLYSDFFANRRKFHNSNLYKIVKKMPKGIIHHLHIPAIGDINSVLKMMDSPNLYIDKKFKVIYKKSKKFKYKEFLNI